MSVRRILAGAALFGQGFSTDVCSDGWTFDGVDKCHKILNTPMTFEEAEVACREAITSPSQLAVPTHHAVQDGIFRASSAKRVWLGIKRTDKGLRDLSGNSLTFTQWYGGQPDNYKNEEDCVEMSDAGSTFYYGHFAAGWNTIKCDESNVYPMCQSNCEGCHRQTTCSAGWRQEFDVKKNANTENCYKVSEDFKTWGEAQCTCARSGGHLVNIDSKGVNMFYENLLRREPILWIGSRKENNKWVSTDMKNQKFNNWFPGAPDNYGGEVENCAQLIDLGTEAPWSDIYAVENLPFVGGWNDGICSDKLRYICQRPITSKGEAQNCTIYTDSAASATHMTLFNLVALILALYFA